MFARIIALAVVALLPCVSIAADEILKYEEVYRLAQAGKYPVMIIVTSDNCMPCELLKTDVIKMKRAGKIRGLIVGEVNADSDPLNAKKFPASAFPTVYLFDKSGKGMHRFQGRPGNLAEIIKEKLGVE